METATIIFAVLNLVLFVYGLTMAVIYQWREDYSKATFFLVFAVWMSMSLHR